MDDDLHRGEGHDHDRRQRPIPQHVVHDEPERDRGQDDREQEAGDIAAQAAMRGMVVAMGAMLFGLVSFQPVMEAA